jgi:hypothetical protein
MNTTTSNGVEPKVVYGNYHYSLTNAQQTSLQLYLRTLPSQCQNSPAWELLHELTYADSWTDGPAFEEKEGGVIPFVARSYKMVAELDMQDEEVAG